MTATHWEHVLQKTMPMGDRVLDNNNSFLTEEIYMDDSNQYLKHLLRQTDLAFDSLLREPSSSYLNEQYEKAKLDLDSYTASVKQTLAQRHYQKQQR